MTRSAISRSRKSLSTLLAPKQKREKGKAHFKQREEERAQERGGRVGRPNLRWRFKVAIDPSIDFASLSERSCQ